MAGDPTGRLLSDLGKLKLELGRLRDKLGNVASQLDRRVSSLDARREGHDQELTRPMAELTEAKGTITALERTTDDIHSLVLGRVAPIRPISLLDIALILLVSTGVALLFNTSSPNRVILLPESLFRPPPHLATVAEVKRMLDETDAVLVDARPVEFYRLKHIKGAVNVPLDVFDVVHMMKLSHLEPERPIIVYGRTISRHYDEEVAHRLTQRDQEDVKVFAGGLSAWERQGYPVEQ